MAIVTRDHVAAELQHHIGKHNGIKGRELAARLNIPSRRLRRLISELIDNGVAILGTPETGYYVAGSPDELERCCKFHHARAMHSLKKISKLKGIPLEELVGQLKLPT